MENCEKQIFDEKQERQAKFIKKYMLFVFGLCGTVFTVAAVIMFCLDIMLELPIIFLSLGLFLIILGIVLYFAVPVKYNYDKYKARIKKYGLINIYEINAKINDLEQRIEELENRDKQ